MRCRRFLVVMLCLCSWGAAAESGAAPLTVAYLDSTTGREWAQLTGSTGFYWWEVDAVCANTGSVACTANLGTVEVAGWTWAITSQVMDLVANLTDLDTSQLSRFEFDPAYGTVYRPPHRERGRLDLGTTVSRDVLADLCDGTSQAVMDGRRMASTSIRDPRSCPRLSMPRWAAPIRQAGGTS
jgi:hypothetical protein